jgi:ribosomal protein S18 acetylase RimI-like enzyme
MSVQEIHDRAELARWFGRDPALHMYEIGDLDDFFWPSTRWYRLAGGDQVALLYDAPGLPVLLAQSRPEAAAELRRLVAELAPVIPERAYAHVTDGVESALEPACEIAYHGRHLKMALTEPAPLDAVTGTQEAKPLTVADRDDMERLYARSYPGNWFDPRMLETGQYVGIRREGILVAIAGVHVYSAVHRVAALGNVTTDPAHRGRGLATTAVAALCHRLAPSVDHIGLNVEADNDAAVGLYRGLGFSVVRDYHEVTITAAG